MGYRPTPSCHLFLADVLLSGVLLWEDRLLFTLYCRVDDKALLLRVQAVTYTARCSRANKNTWASWSFGLDNVLFEPVSWAHVLPVT